MLEPAEIPGTVYLGKKKTSAVFGAHTMKETRTQPLPQETCSPVAVEGSRNIDFF